MYCHDKCFVTKTVKHIQHNINIGNTCHDFIISLYSPSELGFRDEGCNRSKTKVTFSLEMKNRYYYCFKIEVYYNLVTQNDTCFTHYNYKSKF